ncbi:alanine aminotransferase 1 [Octopus bimaculoides]|uniref:alanine transaminase n=1 Tax=Octopus bimaculoides TaxID=37653 RepID=A0A0L8HS06_OCTBM|nr:alanine aminotransferase 1 [Octopus bimaculoides]|eukprot:XP_014769914.1 PREDICTED: alanine aminotransferase 1-like [Octopus bimaculoides]
MDSVSQKEKYFEHGSKFDIILQMEDYIQYSYLKEIIVLCLNSDLLVSSNFSDDAKQLANHYLSNFEENDVGVYSETIGDDFIRKDVTNYILERDDGLDLEADEEVLIDNNECSLLINILEFLIGAHMNSGYGILIPYPSSPIIREAVEICGFLPVPYYLTEAADHWTIEEEALVKALEGSDCKINCMILENPGYPTGHLSSEKELEIFFRVAKNHGIVLIAIENLQMDVHRKNNFLSSRKALIQMGEIYKSVQLMSLFSSARSPQGDKGMHISFIDSFRMDKLTSKFGNLTFTSPASIHQVYLSLFLAPKYLRKYPSFRKFENERYNFIELLGNLAEITVDFFNLQPYMCCSRVFAGHCAFPKLLFPTRWITNRNEPLDLEESYCCELYGTTGIYVVPGKVFGENPDSMHFKFTFPLDQILLHEQLEKIRQFHQKFIQSFIA